MSQARLKRQNMAWKACTALSVCLSLISGPLDLSSRIKSLFMPAFKFLQEAVRLGCLPSECLHSEEALIHKAEGVHTPEPFLSG